MAPPDHAAIVLDSGAVIGLARGSRALRALIESAHHAGTEIVVPMVVVTETTRGNGPRDAAVNLVINRLAPHPLLDEPTARRAGVLLGRSGTAKTIDALVAAEALRQAPAALLTSDPNDMELLLRDESTVAVVDVRSEQNGQP
jgi:predicted nucleic acid-binding protein